MALTEEGMNTTMLVSPANGLANGGGLFGNNGDSWLGILFLIALCNGGFGCWALTEADSGSDASSLSTTYRQEGDEYVINGSKTFATLGAYADMYIVFATKDKKLGKDGVSAFLVPGGLPGIVVGKSENKMGMRLSNTATVSFDDVRIPVGNMLPAIFMPMAYLPLIALFA